MKAFRQVGLLVFLALAALGFVYFGPVEYTGVVTRTDFYRYYLGPHLDRFMSLTGQGSLTIAYLFDSEGSVDFTPGNDTVTLPARPGQRFSRRTTVSTSSRSRAVIALVDDSKVTLEANSTILLDIPTDDSTEALTLKVLGGSVTAERSATSTTQITIVSPKGVAKELTQAKLAVVTTKAAPGAADVAKDSQEFFGTPEEPLEAIQSKLATARREELQNADTGFEAVADAEEQARAAEAARAPASEAEAVPVEPERPTSFAPRRKAASIRWAPPPEGNDLSQAFFAERAGRKDDSKRLMARALTKPGYQGEGFSESTRVALDGLLRGYVENGDARLAQETLRNAKETYGHDAAAQDWLREWDRRLGSSSSSRVPASVKPGR